MRRIERSALGERNGQPAAGRDSIVEVAQRSAPLVQEALANAQDLKATGQVRRGLRRPRAVACDLGAGRRFGQVGAGAHEVDGLVEGHVADVQAGVDDDSGGTEQRRLDLRHLVARLSEESLLAHELLGVQAPALSEVRSTKRAPNRAGVAPGGHQVPVVAGVGFVNGRRRNRGITIVLRALLDLLLGRAIGRERNEEVAAHRGRKRRRAVVRGDGCDWSLEQRRGLDGALFAWRQRHQTPLAEELARSLGPVSVGPKHGVGGGGMVGIEVPEDTWPVFSAFQHLSAATQVLGESVVFAATSLAEGGRVVLQQLLLAE